jgi:hypothetical protein
MAIIIAMHDKSNSVHLSQLKNEIRNYKWTNRPRTLPIGMRFPDFWLWMGWFCYQ